jgi:hypothetical protein
MQPTYADVFDPDLFPNIVECIVTHLDYPDALALRDTSAKLWQYVNKRIYTHVVSGTYPIGLNTSDGEDGIHPCPDEWYQALDLVEANTVILDIEGPLPPRDMISVQPIIDAARHACTFRAKSYFFAACPDSVRPLPLLPPTLVLAYGCLPGNGGPEDWNTALPMFMDTIPDGPTRVVMNVTYAWTTQLFYVPLALRPDIFPTSVEELVIHLRKLDIERPRYMRCKRLGDGNTAAVEGYTASSPTPTLAEDEYLDVVLPYPLRGPNQNIFRQLAQFLAGNGTGALAAGVDPAGSLDEAGKGGYHVPSKITIVGLDEFDAARDADVAGEDVFEAMMDKLPWGGPPPARFIWEHPPYRPLAPSAVQIMASAVEPSQRADLESRIRVVTSEEYRAGLAVDERYDEDWWTEASCTECVQWASSTVAAGRGAG